MMTGPRQPGRLSEEAPRSAAATIGATVTTNTNTEASRSWRSDDSMALRPAVP